MFRREVANGADDLVRRRDSTGSVEGAPDAQVEEHDAARVTVLEEDVVRLDVAVDDRTRVEDGERLAEPRAEPSDLLGLEGASREPRRELLAIEPAHCQPGQSVSLGAVRHMADDGGMVELGEEARLTQEAPRVPGV